MMGTEKKQLEVRPRFSNTGKENVELVRNQLADSAGIETAILFAAQARRHRESMESGGLLDEHPVTLAAREVGASVHWVA